MTMLLAWRVLGLLATVYALIVATARVYSGVHWPGDVIVGLGVGAFLACIIWRLTPPVFGLVGRRAWVEEPPAASESTEEERPQDVPM